MNSKLSDAIARVRELPQEQQDAAADLLFDFLEHEGPEAGLTPEQIAELDRRLDENDVASDEEVKAFFGRFKA
jgi:hypothetical protein